MSSERSNLSSKRYYNIFHSISRVLVLSTLILWPFFHLDLLIPITLDSKPSWNTLSIVPSNPLLNNMLLMAIFILQHSILKKPVNKLILHYFPAGMEMSFYSLVSSLLIYMIYLCWMPMTDYKLWDIQIWWLYYGVIGLEFLSFCAFLKVTFGTTAKIDNLDLGLEFLSFFAFLKVTFGTTIKIENLELGYNGSSMDSSNGEIRSRPEKCPVSKRPSKVYKGGIYGYIRHPMMTFLMCSMCITPTMTIGHALWSGVMTVYTITAVIVFEESALIQEFGEEYKQYMKEVPGFIPDLRKLFQIR